jgi:hypothetical protein
MNLQMFDLTFLAASHSQMKKNKEKKHSFQAKNEDISVCIIIIN